MECGNATAVNDAEISAGRVRHVDLVGGCIYGNRLRRVRLWVNDRCRGVRGPVDYRYAAGVAASDRGNRATSVRNVNPVGDRVYRDCDRGKCIWIGDRRSGVR